MRDKILKDEHQMEWSLKLVFNNDMVAQNRGNTLKELLELPPFDYDYVAIHPDALQFFIEDYQRIKENWEKLQETL